MHDEDQGVIDVHTGRAMVVRGDPLCDHIWKSSADELWQFMWLECTRCEGHITIRFTRFVEVPGGAS